MSELGALLPRVTSSPPGPRSRALAERLRAVESRNVTWLSDDFPVFWEEARGANVRDSDGNVYLDLTGAFGVALAGHAHPAVTDAVRRQATRLVHGMGDVHPPTLKVELLERLAGLAPWEESRTVLASTGSEAVEVALKTALLATDRPGILAVEGGYHGLTLGALAATARAEFRALFGQRVYGGVGFLPFPGTGDADKGGSVAADGEAGVGAEGRVGVAPDEALSEARRILEEGAPNGDPVGAVVVEAVQGRAGVRIFPEGFLAELAGVARDAGALLVLDEVFTGFGRTGRLFAFEHEGVVPDLLCVGKALGGGLPVSACMGRASVMDAWPPSEGEALHTSTFLGHPLGAAAALAFLDLLEAEALVERSRKLGDALLARLRDELSGLMGVREVRGRGLFVGIELADPATGGAAPGSGARVATAALARGLLVLPAGEAGEVVELAPPAVLTEKQIEWAAGALAETVAARESTGGDDLQRPTGL